MLARVHSPSDDLVGVVAGDTWTRLASVVVDGFESGEDVSVRKTYEHVVQSEACTHTCDTWKVNACDT